MNAATPVRVLHKYAATTGPIPPTDMAMATHLGSYTGHLAAFAYLHTRSRTLRLRCTSARV
eukprot:2204093-Rhodomonas_salina.1